ncbi:MAG: thioredoxin family protein [Bacteroidota bacterium]
MKYRIKYWMVLLCLGPLLILYASRTNTAKFPKGSLSSAKNIAAKEGKLYLVDFVASWCMPCKWMEETTFANAEVSDYMAENYVAVKIDIDDFDGYAYKQIYDIKILPSILIFNSKGELLEQYQESLSPSRMLKVLQKHNTPSNRIALPGGPQAYAPPSPSKQQKEQIRPAQGHHKVKQKPIASAPAKPKVSKPTRPKVEKPIPNAPKPRINQVQSQSNQEINRPSSASPDVITNEGLYRFKVSRQASKGFSVQIGAFLEYSNVLREVASLEGRFNEPIIVHIIKRNQQPVYKVLLGEFEDREQADHFKAYVLENGLPEAMIKDLSTI